MSHVTFFLWLSFQFWKRLNYSHACMRKQTNNFKIEYLQSKLWKNIVHFDVTWMIKQLFDWPNAGKIAYSPPYFFYFQQMLASFFFFQAKEVVHFLVNRDHLLTSLQYEGPEAEKVGKCRFDRCMPSASRHVSSGIFWMVKKGFHLLHKEPD